MCAFLLSLESRIKYDLKNGKMAPLRIFTILQQDDNYQEFNSKCISIVYFSNKVNLLKTFIKLYTFLMSWLLNVLLVNLGGCCQWVTAATHWCVDVCVNG